MFTKILIANRGEIACRIIRTARAMGIRTVAVYSDADRGARHVRLADEACHIGAAAAKDSYLCGDVILDFARKTAAEAIHPGYGFLSENADFAEACIRAGLIFIGPSPDCIRMMGLKHKAKDIMIKAGVPVVPGYQGEDQAPAELQHQADRIGYPLLIKAVAGGGGKGMRLVTASADFSSALESCQREATSSFGSPDVLLEKYLSHCRHIEIQIFGDSSGEAVHLYERDCSLQRRHQKVVEEAPAPGLSRQMRAAMGTAAVTAARAIGYCGAGTIEFIVDVENGLENATFYFMEMNTRLQVEHPVTEMITGQDLVAWQLRLAAGEKLPLTQDKIPLEGHAIEVRLYAEDPENDFMPQSGRISHFSADEPGRDFRLESGIEAGDDISIHYDPMMAKLIVHDRDRDGALRQMRAVLSNMVVAGVKSNLGFLGAIIRHPAFSHPDTGFIDRYRDELIPADKQADDSVIILAAMAELDPARTSGDPWEARDGWRMNLKLETTLTFVDHNHRRDIMLTYLDNGFLVRVEGQEFDVEFLNYDGIRLDLMVSGHKIMAKVAKNGQDFTVFYEGAVSYLHHYLPGVEETNETADNGVIITPMPGKVSQVMVQNGDEVTAGTQLMILEAMKMEHTIKAALNGTVAGLSVTAGDQVSDGEILVRIIAADEL